MLTFKSLPQFLYDKYPTSILYVEWINTRIHAVQQLQTSQSCEDNYQNREHMLWKCRSIRKHITAPSPSRYSDVLSFTQLWCHGWQLMPEHFFVLCEKFCAIWSACVNQFIKPAETQPVGLLSSRRSADRSLSKCIMRLYGMQKLVPRRWLPKHTWLQLPPLESLYWTSDNKPNHTKQNMKGNKSRLTATYITFKI